MTPVAIAGYLALFFGLGGVFLAVNLFVGSRIRPFSPSKEKLEIYECGEPTIGSSFVQFDLRFYVVALLFIIFDVEVAFFFPWAVVFGKSVALSDVRTPIVQTVADGTTQYSAMAQGLMTEMGLPLQATALTTESGAALHQAAQQMSWLAVCDVLVFFGVLMVGFAYVWRRGDLDWVRAVSQQRADSAIEIHPVTLQPGRSVFDREPALHS